MSAMIVPVGARRTRDEVPATVKRAFLPLITMFAISTGVAAALDTTGHGGIIEGVTANGASGFVTARVSNPFDVPVAGSISFTTQNSDGSTTTTTVNFSLDAYGSQNFDGSPGVPFTSSTEGANVGDASGQNTATGWAWSSAPSCSGCPNDY